MDGRVRLIIVMYGEIKNIDNLDDEFKHYLKYNIYIKWGEPEFWNKLRKAFSDEQS